jgi:hypothetical protein
MRRRDHETIINELKRQLTYLQRQNDQLLDKLMYVTGSTWTPPPTPDLTPEEVAPSFEWAPEQSLDAVFVEE